MRYHLPVLRNEIQRLEVITPTLGWKTDDPVNMSFNTCFSGISEIIRFQTPVAHMRRTATQDINFQGKEIKKGDKIILWYISGNRDASIISDPNNFIVNRNNHDTHLAFGAGVHRCIGKNIALLQLKKLWQEIIRRGLIIKKVSEPERIRSNMVHGYSSLIVELIKI